MIANHEVTLVQQYAVVGLVSIPLFLLAGAGTIYIHDSCFGIEIFFSYLVYFTLISKQSKNKLQR